MERIDNPMASFDHSDDIQCRQIPKHITDIQEAYEKLSNELFDVKWEFDGVKGFIKDLHFLDIKENVIESYTQEISRREEELRDIEANLKMKGYEV